MRLSLLPLFLSLLLSAGPLYAEKKPTRIVSLNLCTDQLLMLLVPEERIASVSSLSRQPESSFMATTALRLSVNHGRAEELLPLQPDLVLAGTHAAKSAVALLRRLGHQVELFPMANNIASIRSNIRRLAALVGEEQRGEQLIREMDQRITRVTAALDGAPQAGALIYQPRGYTSGSDTLQDEALQLAGWRNLAAESGIVGFGRIDLERLLLAQPQRIFTSQYAPGSYSIAQRLIRHPALRRTAGDSPVTEVDYRLWICGGPMIAEAVEALAAAHRP
jgi:iron complex transport system substrate-binding protein